MVLAAVAQRVLAVHHNLAVVLAVVEVVSSQRMFLLVLLLVLAVSRIILEVKARLGQTTHRLQPLEVRERKLALVVAVADRRKQLMAQRAALVRFRGVAVVVVDRPAQAS